MSGGPISVSFEVYDDFSYYSGGIYHHTGLTDSFNPFEVGVSHDLFHNVPTFFDIHQNTILKFY